MDADGFDDTGLKVLLAAVIHDAGKYGDRGFFKSKWFGLICDFMGWAPYEIRKMVATGVKEKFTIPREFRA